LPNRPGDWKNGCVAKWSLLPFNKRKDLGLLKRLTRSPGRSSFLRKDSFRLSSGKDYGFSLLSRDGREFRILKIIKTGDFNGQAGCQSNDSEQQFGICDRYFEKDDCPVDR
jgi:hypothetical protein